MQQIQSQLQPHSFHVRLLQRAGDVHVHVKEAVQRAPQLRLLNFQLRE